MQITINVIAAEEEESQSIGESDSPLDQWSGIETNGLDTVKIATLHSILTGDPLHLALDLYEPVYVFESDDGAGVVVLRLADELLEKLTLLGEDALECAANELVATEEFENEQRNVEDVLELLTVLSDLAQLAESQGQVLFVWMRLDPD